jgi:hypothetical protein
VQVAENWYTEHGVDTMDLDVVRDSAVGHLQALKMYGRSAVVYTHWSTLTKQNTDTIKGKVGKGEAVAPDP